eukprot:1159718-Pelagomonas_calceolata.AAC.6
MMGKTYLEEREGEVDQVLAGAVHLRANTAAAAALGKGVVQSLGLSPIRAHQHLQVNTAAAAAAAAAHGADAVRPLHRNLAGAATHMHAMERTHM